MMRLVSSNTISTSSSSILICFSVSLLICIILISIRQNPSLPQPQSKMSESQYSNAYKRLHIVPNPDGSITRIPEFFPTVASNSSSSATPSLSKDSTISHLHHTWARLFLPRQALSTSQPTRLPILVFVHGGGFILGSAADPLYQGFCNDAATRLGALIVSLEYRLAPEHRLPAPYDDVLEALTWLRDAKDDWVRDYGDFSRCLLIGESAGGNIVYNAGLMAARRLQHFKPLLIKGLVLIQPYFGGLDLTASEFRLAHDPVLPFDVNQLMWSMALPLGANRGHQFCDPTAAAGSGLLDPVRDSEWQVGVIASDGDPLFDRDVGLINLMERTGIQVRSMLSKGDTHGVFVSNHTKRNDLYDFVKDFLS